MKNTPNFVINVGGSLSEIFVSDNDGGRFMCVFVKAGPVDFSAIYQAYGFMVWTPIATHTKYEFFPIKLKEETKLTKELMQQMWSQISNKIEI